MRRISRTEAGGFLMIMAAAVITASPSADPPRRYEVEVEGLEFRPSLLQVRSGDTVVWINRDPVPHTVSPRDGAWDSGAMSAAQSFTWVAEDAGRMEYACRYHPLMDGVVEVSDR